MFFWITFLLDVPCFPLSLFFLLLKLNLNYEQPSKDPSHSNQELFPRLRPQPHQLARVPPSQETQAKTKEILLCDLMAAISALGATLSAVDKRPHSSLLALILHP